MSDYKAVLQRQQFTATIQRSAPPAPPPDPFQLGHTWGLLGDVSAFTTLPSLFIPLRAGQAAALAGLRTKIGSGTSVDVRVELNGTQIGSAITVTQTAMTASLGQVPLANNDEVTVTLSNPSGNPSNLTLTLILEQTP